MPSEGFPDPGIGHKSLRSPAVAGGIFTIIATWETLIILLCMAAIPENVFVFKL